MILTPWQRQFDSYTTGREAGGSSALAMAEYYREMKNIPAAQKAQIENAIKNANMTDFEKAMYGAGFRMGEEALTALFRALIRDSMQIRGRNERVRVTTDCSGPSATKQAFAYECDVNVIVERYRKTGDPSILGVPNGPPNYADVSDIGDYAECLAVVKTRRKRF